jgi:hypothetical protein
MPLMWCKVYGSRLCAKSNANLQEIIDLAAVYLEVNEVSSGLFDVSNGDW